MKVAIYQTDPVLLDLKANLEEIIDKINHGREQGAQLIVFPELALTGYFVGPRYHEVALRLDSPEILKLASATKGTAAVVGFIEESPSMNFYCLPSAKKTTITMKNKPSGLLSARFATR